MMITKMMVNPSSRSFSLLFFSFPSILPSFGKLTGGRGRGEEENTAELENGRPSKEKERNDSKRYNSSKFQPLAVTKGKGDRQGNMKITNKNEKYRSRCEKLKGKSALNATIQEKEKT